MIDWIIRHLPEPNTIQLRIAPYRVTRLPREQLQAWPWRVRALRWAKSRPLPFIKERDKAKVS